MSQQPLENYLELPSIDHSFILWCVCVYACVHVCLCVCMRVHVCVHTHMCTEAKGSVSLHFYP